MTAVIHQPYFLPWMGYFSKLVYADKFIVLDNVNFTKGSFIDRTQIVGPNGDLIWLTMPVGQQFKKHCNEIHFSNVEIVENMVKTLYSIYSKARYFRSSIKAG